MEMATIEKCSGNGGCENVAYIPDSGGSKYEVRMYVRTYVSVCMYVCMFACV